MRIKKVRLKNGYKRFRDLTIDLGDTPARIVALVGPNGSGKSSVLDGLLYLATAYQPIGEQGRRDASYHSMDGTNSFSHENIEVDFVEGPFAEVKNNLHNSGKGNTIFSFRSPYRYNSRVKIDQISATQPIEINNYGASDTSNIDAKMELNYRRLQATVNNYMQQNDARPSEAISEILGRLNTSITNCLDIEISNIGNVEGGRGTLYFSKKDHPREFEFNVLSSGEKEVIDLLLDLYLRRGEYSNTIFLIDEPELHINTSIQSKLLNEIDRLVGENCQIWLTTHSIGFMRALQTNMKEKCQIVQFRAHDMLATRPTVLTPAKLNSATWRDIFTVALDDLAILISPQQIIYCEGRDRPGKGGVERGTDAQVLNTIFAQTHPNTLFISSGGNTELDQRSAIAILILGKVFPNVEIIVFKDRDMASGKQVDEHARQIYLKTNPTNHRIMKRFELENYLYDKQVLQAYCAGNGLTFDTAAYDAFVTDITNMNLKDHTGQIKTICGIVGSVNREAFKISLADYLTPDTAAFVELVDCIFNRA